MDIHHPPFPGSPVLSQWIHKEGGHGGPAADRSHHKGGLGYFYRNVLNLILVKWLRAHAIVQGNQPEITQWQVHFPEPLNCNNLSLLKIKTYYDVFSFLVIILSAPLTIYLLNFPWSHVTQFRPMRTEVCWDLGEKFLLSWSHPLPPSLNLLAGWNTDMMPSVSADTL